jgi:hypothetical protein
VTFIPLTGFIGPGISETRACVRPCNDRRVLATHNATGVPVTLSPLPLPPSGPRQHPTAHAQVPDPTAHGPRPATINASLAAALYYGARIRERDSFPRSLRLDLLLRVSRALGRQ